MSSHEDFEPSDLDYKSDFDYETLEERVNQTISEPLTLACTSASMKIKLYRWWKQ